MIGIKGQPVVKSVYIQAPMNYFDSNRTIMAFLVKTHYLGLRVVMAVTSIGHTDSRPTKSQISSCEVKNFYKYT